MEVSQREGVTRRRMFFALGVAARPSYGKFGTCLGVLCEEVNTTYAGVNGVEMDADASIRVVPPSFRSLVGMEDSAFSRISVSSLLICGMKEQ